MSYCRWSTDDFKCDLYCYESDRGYETHVAGNRHVGEIPTLLPFPPKGSPPEAWDEFKARYDAQLAWLDTCERQPIGLPSDGEFFTDPDLPSFLARLGELRAEGYRFPDDVLETVRAEIADPPAGNPNLGGQPSE